MADLKDILNNENQLPANDDLLRYVGNNLSPAEQHAFEKKALESDFVTDAVEGLTAFNHTSELNNYVAQLNNNLHQQLIGKKKRKSKRPVNQHLYIIITALALLAICVFGYLFIYFWRK